MNETRRLGAAELVALLLIVAVAAGVRFWYVSACADGGYGAAPLEVQGAPAFAAPPLAVGSGETTAHVAPGHAWLVGFLERWDMAADATLRWAHAVLGTLTAACYFFFARRAYEGLLVATLAGLLAAVHPFWIANTAEVGDGVLTTFLLGACLMLGARAGQEGGPCTSLLYGLALAGLAMTRAALLPFALAALLWFLLRCRELRGGWFCAVVAFLGFGNGLAPWTFRNFREFEEPVPVADSALLHLWIGNNPKATGGPMTDEMLRQALPPERLETLLAEKNQARRYALLGQDVTREVRDDPGAALGRRLWAGLMFVFGENWFGQEKTLARVNPEADPALEPDWLRDTGEALLRGSLLTMLLLGVLGWRLSARWRRDARLATLAALWVPLPYLLTHAERLSGPRLPLDGVWLCFVAAALVSWWPGLKSAKS